MRPARLARRLALFLVAGLVWAPLLYLGAGLGLGAWPTGDAPAHGSIPLAIIANAFHSDLVFPLDGDSGTDWRTLFDLPAEARYVAIGWGDRRFYLETPRLQDLRLGTAVHALTGTGDAVLHVAWYSARPVAENMRPLPVLPDQARTLARYVLGALVIGPDGRPVQLAPGYGPDDAFFPARGHWTPRVTCNEWIARGLRSARIRTGLWTPFADGVLRHLATYP